MGTTHTRSHAQGDMMDRSNKMKSPGAQTSLDSGQPGLPSRSCAWLDGQIPTGSGINGSTVGCLHSVIIGPTNPSREAWCWSTLLRRHRGKRKLIRSRIERRESKNATRHILQGRAGILGETETELQDGGGLEGPHSDAST